MNHRIWGEWFEDKSGGDRRRVAFDKVGEVEVSTVFLGVDHGARDGGAPVLFETMIFGGSDEIDQSQWRYTSRADALIGHAAALALVHAECEAGGAS